MIEVDPAVLVVAAASSGMSEDAIARAVQTYRRAAQGLHVEPEWRMVSSISGADGGLALYAAEGTKVALQVETPRTAQGYGKGEIYYVYEGKAFETFGEARSIELREKRGDGNVVPIAGATEGGDRE